MCLKKLRRKKHIAVFGLQCTIIEILLVGVNYRNLLGWCRPLCIMEKREGRIE